MKKKILIGMVLVVLVLASTMVSFADTSEISVVIDGKKVTYNDTTGRPFMDSSNRVLVPLRATMEEFGCNVFWTGEYQRISVLKEMKGDVWAVLAFIDRDYIMCNGIETKLDTAPCIVHGRTYLPIRAVLEGFEASVNWNPTTKTIAVSSTPTFTIPWDMAAVRIDNITINEKSYRIIKSQDTLSGELVSLKDPLNAVYLFPVEQWDNGEMFHFCLNDLFAILTGEYTVKPNNIYNSAGDIYIDNKNVLQCNKTGKYEQKYLEEYIFTYNGKTFSYNYNHACADGCDYITPEGLHVISGNLNVKDVLNYVGVSAKVTPSSSKVYLSSDSNNWVELDILNIEK